ncbi:MAG: hypothetical protein HMLIMOIP_001287 [Candidatus Nitrosomirales archaeon]|jgi:hypothetical protein
MTFTSDTTITSDQTLGPGDVWTNPVAILTIASGITINNNGGTINNVNTIVNYGTI